MRLCNAVRKSTSHRWTSDLNYQSFRYVFKRCGRTSLLSNSRKGDQRCTTADDARWRELLQVDERWCDKHENDLVIIGSVQRKIEFQAIGICQNSNPNYKPPLFPLWLLTHYIGKFESVVKLITFPNNFILFAESHQLSRLSDGSDQGGRLWAEQSGLSGSSNWIPNTGWISTDDIACFGNRIWEVSYQC